MTSPKHVAIIMDGNGRWGKKKNKSRNFGHKAGIKTIERIVNASIENKIDYGRLENKLPKTVNYSFKKSNSDLPIIVGIPDKMKPKISIITYGGSIHCALESIDEKS